MVSPQNVIYDPFGSGGSFTPVSGLSRSTAPTSPARAMTSRLLSGWSGGVGGTLLQTMTFNDPDTEPTFIVVQLTGIDAVSFDGLASTLQVVIDDISVTSPTPVPGALPLFATGLAGVGMLFLYRRKRTAAAA